MHIFYQIPKRMYFYTSNEYFNLIIIIIIFMFQCRRVTQINSFIPFFRINKNEEINNILNLLNKTKILSFNS